MAFKKIAFKSDGTPEEPIKGSAFDVSNGDLNALGEIIKKWNFKSEAEALRFALAVMRQAEDEVVYVDQGGKKVGLTPSDDLLNKEQAAQ